MLKKINRLSSKFEYNITKKYGANASGRFAHVYLLKPTNYTGPAKAGIVIPNSFNKSAVKRNRIKRLFREALRLNFDKIPENHWLVVYPRYSSQKKTYEEICTDLINTIQKVSVTR